MNWSGVSWENVSGDVIAIIEVKDDGDGGDGDQ